MAARPTADDAAPPDRSRARRAHTGGGRLLAYTVGVCLAGSGLALFAATRVWSVQVVARPGLSDLRTTRTGAAELPWLPALALVGLAGVGALLATRGWPRRAVGALLAAAGAGLVLVVLAGGAGRGPGAAGVVWPWATVLGGLALAVGGYATMRHGHRWPAMGARYERRAATASPADVAGADDTGTADGPAGAGESGVGRRPPGPRAQSRRAAGPVDTRAAWDALDRGDDPTLD